jgi:hypothetical protein
VASSSGQQGGWTRGAELSWDPKAQASSPALTYHALVIGIGDYGQPRNARGWGDLETARKDAQAVGALLKDRYNFKVKQLLDAKATREAIMLGLDDLTELGVNDAAVVYFAGHGYYDEKLGEGFWIPQDGAFKRGERLAKENWIWNSTVSTVLEGSEARHILVVSDSCYSGSLFRSAPRPAAQQDLQWYKRVNAKPSRYLITGGDHEPVLDSGGKHSIFAQHVLDYLQQPGQQIFAASDLGFAVRQRVSQKTGQLVRMGPLNMSTHAGGEFVFIGKSADD